jgi:hypothetical protein
MMACDPISTTYCGSWKPMSSTRSTTELENQGLTSNTGRAILIDLTEFLTSNENCQLQAFEYRSMCGDNEV